MHTIFAPITNIAKSSICTIRISGEKTSDCLKILGVEKNIKPNEIKFTKIFDPKTNELIDEVLFSFFKAPNSFTGEDVAEISFHASKYILKKIIQTLSEIPSVRFAEAGEFSKIAFLNNKLDLVQAEAIVDLIASESAAQHKQALKQLRGELGAIYDQWRFQTIETLALIESVIDFPDEDLPQNIIDQVESNIKNLQKEISNHLNDNKRGQKIKDGLSLAIIGAPNVGKSSLMNYLANSEVAIVSDIAGTTRDIIETHLEIGGYAVKIADTAGLRISKNKIEQEGIKRARQRAIDADLKIYMLDAKKPVLDESLIDQNTIVILNKSDLLGEGKKIKIKYDLAISLTEKKNLDEVIKLLEEKIQKIIPDNSQMLITQERYRNSLINCHAFLENFSLEKNIELAAEDLRLASYEIAKITGRINVDDILDIVFSKFCIGK